MSQRKTPSSSSSDSAVQGETSYQAFAGESSVSKSTTTYRPGLSSYTRVTRSKTGYFDDHDLTLKKFEDAKDTFTDLEAAYKKFNLRIKTLRDEHKNEVSDAIIQLSDYLLYSLARLWYLLLN